MSLSARMLVGLVMLSSLFGCGGRHVVQPPQPPSGDLSLQVRAVGNEEILEQCRRDPELSPSACREILARLNTKDAVYVSEYMARGDALKVPNDFRSYKTWTPLPRHLPQVADNRKFILVVKDIPFLGWYEKGRLKGDTQICIGKQWEWTKAGTYAVQEKDSGHFSQTYKSALGYPALMPYALRIYGHVWVHGGDVVGGYCSRGCINLPLSTSEVLFDWADKGTKVLVVDSLKGLDEALKKRPTRRGRGSRS